MPSAPNGRHATAFAARFTGFSLLMFSVVMETPAVGAQFSATAISIVVSRELIWQRKWND
jgi:hypothetical protein